jgi:hypothetical protein
MVGGRRFSWIFNQSKNSVVKNWDAKVWSRGEMEGTHLDCHGLLASSVRLFAALLEIIIHQDHLWKTSVNSLSWVSK